MKFRKACYDSPKLLNTVLSCIQHVIVVADLEGQILFVNSVVEDVFGFTTDELEGKDLSIIFTPEDLNYLYPNLLFMAKKKKPFEGEIMLIDKHGKRFFAFMVFKPCHNPDQDQTVVVISIRNIDKRKQLEKTFRETPYQDLIKLADGVAHELRNPLVAIGGTVRRLHRLSENEPGQKDYYDRIYGNLKRIEGIIRKVEFFAHLPKPSLKEESLRALIEQAVVPYQQQLEAQTIDLKIDLQDVMLLVDKELVITAFSILIENALSALSPEGRILIHGKVQDNECKVYVSDTGSGITPENMAYIFKPFFSTKSGGAGLDLPLLKRIMDSHGGKVDVQSKPDEGTTFFLLFPLERRRALRITHLQD